MQYSASLTEASPRPVRLVGAGWGIGARDTRCDMGPTALRAGKLARSLRESGVGVDWGGIVASDAHEPADTVAAVSGLCTRLAAEIDTALREGCMPVVLGGDCSVLLGCGLAMRRMAERDELPYGLSTWTATPTSGIRATPRTWARRLGRGWRSPPVAGSLT